jgi:hypothetical protein
MKHLKRLKQITTQSHKLMYNFGQNTLELQIEKLIYFGFWNF